MIPDKKKNNNLRFHKTFWVITRKHENKNSPHFYFNSTFWNVWGGKGWYILIGTLSFLACGKRREKILVKPFRNQINKTWLVTCRDRINNEKKKVKLTWFVKLPSSTCQKSKLFINFWLNHSIVYNLINQNKLREHHQVLLLKIRQI